MEPMPDPTTVSPRPAPATYLVVLTAAGRAAAPALGTVRRLVDRGHRVVVLAAAGLAPEVRAVGAEHRPWDDDRSDDAVAVAAEATCRAIGAMRPDAVLVAGPVLGALVAAERATVPLGLLGDGAAARSARDARTGRHLLAGVNEVRAAHGLAPLGRVVDQLERADRHVARGDDDAVIDALEALPGCRPWLLVERHHPSRTAAPILREPQLTA